jgi:hypothetical protein
MQKLLPMNDRSPRRTLSRALAIAFSAGLTLIAVPYEAFAQTYVPPDVGLPGRREGGGTRGECSAVDKTLYALMPTNNFGYTVDEYPTFYWYVPQIGAQAAEFVLLDENNNEVFLTTFQIADQPGIISLSLPEQSGFPSLTPGENYHWFFSLICDFNDRSGDLYTDGWVQRTTLESNPSLAMQLSTAPAEDHADIYAEAGIWFNALDELAQGQIDDPSNLQLQSKWSNLLTSVGLEELIGDPFVLQVDGDNVVTPEP